MKHYCYFLFESVPATAPHKLWFSAWSQDHARLEWTEQQPSVADPSAPWMVGVTVYVDEVPPVSAPTLLAKLSTSIKDVPPPPGLQAADVDAKGFRAAFEESFEMTAAKHFLP